MAESEEVVTESRRLDVFCVQTESGAWQTHVHPGWVPQCLKQYFDDNLETRPLHVNFDNVDRHLREQGAIVEKTASKFAAFQMVAYGHSAETLARCLASAFANAPTDDRSSESATSTDAEDDAEHVELLRKLRDGEISREEYFDTTVERGLDHLRGRLSAKQLQVVRETVRGEVESSPVLVKMLGDALESLPKPAVE